MSFHVMQPNKTPICDNITDETALHRASELIKAENYSLSIATQIGNKIIITEFLNSDYINACPGHTG
jgi:hypothetical protein